MSEPTVVCVLRSGGEYKPEHANALLHDIAAFWSHSAVQRVLLTDYPVTEFSPGINVVPLVMDYKGWWSKMELYRPELEYLGDVLFFDLDTIIVGYLDEIAAVRALTMLDDFYRPEQLASGLMYLPVSDRAYVWGRWSEYRRQQGAMTRGDQEFLRTILSGEQRWQRILPGQVVSYKVHVKPNGVVPRGARVVCFHGKPRPWQLGRGL